MSSMSKGDGIDGRARRGVMRAVSRFGPAASSLTHTRGTCLLTVAKHRPLRSACSLLS